MQQNMDMYLESFDSEPYAFEVTKTQADYTSYGFSTDEGVEYQLTFINSPLLGKRCQVIRLGQKMGDAKTFKQILTKFKDPFRVVATLLAIFEEYTQNDNKGKQKHGYGFMIQEKLFGAYAPLVRRVMRLKLRPKFKLYESAYQHEEKWNIKNVNYIYTHRATFPAASVFDGEEGVKVVSGQGTSVEEVELKTTEPVTIPKPVAEPAQPVAAQTKTVKTPKVDKAVQKKAVSTAGAAKVGQVEKPAQAETQAPNQKVNTGGEVNTDTDKEKTLLVDILTGINKEYQADVPTQLIWVKRDMYDIVNGVTLCTMSDAEVDAGVAFSLLDQNEINISDGFDVVHQVPYGPGNLKAHTLLASFIADIAMNVSSGTMIDNGWYIGENRVEMLHFHNTMGKNPNQSILKMYEEIFDILTGGYLEYNSAGNVANLGQLLTSLTMKAPANVTSKEVSIEEPGPKTIADLEYLGGEGDVEFLIKDLGKIVDVPGKKVSLIWAMRGLEDELLEDTAGFYIKDGNVAYSPLMIDDQPYALDAEVDILTEVPYTPNALKAHATVSMFVYHALNNHYAEDWYVEGKKLDMKLACSLFGGDPEGVQLFLSDADFSLKYEDGTTLETSLLQLVDTMTRSADDWHNKTNDGTTGIDPEQETEQEKAVAGGQKLTGMFSTFHVPHETAKKHGMLISVLEDAIGAKTFFHTLSGQKVSKDLEDKFYASAMMDTKYYGELVEPNNQVALARAMLSRALLTGIDPDGFAYRIKVGSAEYTVNLSQTYSSGMGKFNSGDLWKNLVWAFVSSMITDHGANAFEYLVVHDDGNGLSASKTAWAPIRNSLRVVSGVDVVLDGTSSTPAKEVEVPKKEEPKTTFAYISGYTGTVASPYQLTIPSKDNRFLTDAHSVFETSGNTLLVSTPGCEVGGIGDTVWDELKSHDCMMTGVGADEINDFKSMFSGFADTFPGYPSKVLGRMKASTTKFVPKGMFILVAHAMVDDEMGVLIFHDGKFILVKASELRGEMYGPLKGFEYLDSHPGVFGDLIVSGGDAVSATATKGAYSSTIQTSTMATAALVGNKKMEIANVFKVKVGSFVSNQPPVTTKGLAVKDETFEWKYIAKFKNAKLNIGDFTLDADEDPAVLHDKVAGVLGMLTDKAQISVAGDLLKHFCKLSMDSATFMKVSHQHTNGIKNISAVKGYTNGTFTSINKALRGISETDSAITAIKKIDESYGESGIRLPKEMIVFRGQRMSLNALKGMKEGKSFVMWGYTSTSTDCHTALSFSKGHINMYQHAVSKGESDIDSFMGLNPNLTTEDKVPTLMSIKGLDKTLSLVPGEASKYPTECEVILNRGTVLALRKDIKNPLRIYKEACIIHLEVIGEGAQPGLMTESTFQNGGFTMDKNLKFGEHKDATSFEDTFNGDVNRMALLAGAGVNLGASVVDSQADADNLVKWEGDAFE